MHLSLRIRVAALALLVVFLAQPVLGAAVCWQMGATAGSCATPCPMGEEAPPPPVKAEANDPGCCVLSSSDPAPLLSLTANPGVVAAAVPTPVSLAWLSVPAPAVAPTPPEGAPHATSSSLSLLYCVLLI